MGFVSPSFFLLSPGTLEKILGQAGTSGDAC